MIRETAVELITSCFRSFERVSATYMGAEITDSNKGWNSGGGKCGYYSQESVVDSFLWAGEENVFGCDF